MSSQADYEGFKDCGPVNCTSAATSPDLVNSKKDLPQGNLSFDNSDHSSVRFNTDSAGPSVAEEFSQHPPEADTEEYSLNAVENSSPDFQVRYTDSDFGSADGSYMSSDGSDALDEKDLRGPLRNRRGVKQEEVSENSSDENMEKPWKEEPKPKKYRQTILNFGATGASSKKKHKEKQSVIGRLRQRVVGEKKDKSKAKFSFRRGDSDTENYRLGYPGQKDNTRLNANLQFYKGQISSSPDGAFIDDIHNQWWGNYHLLERHHGYIQWIFPIREEGMNWQAQALQLHEAQAIVADKEAFARVLRSYEMMLDFYGMKLKDSSTGEIQRSERWDERYHNLSYSSHNYLRITRILKSLGEFDLEHLKKPLLEFILSEIFERGQLLRTLNSLENYWIGTIKDDAGREELRSYIEENA